jgi:hypothetical protein
MRRVRDVLRLRSAGAGSTRCPPVRCCTVDGPAEIETAGERGAQLAIAGGDDRRRAGNGAICGSRHRQGYRRHLEPDWAEIHPRAQAQERHHGDATITGTVSPA